jgi:hypothetical protein
MYKFPKWLIAFVGCFCILIAIYAIYAIVNAAKLETWSFFVDQFENVYICKMLNIVIISDGETRAIRSPDSRYYVINVEKDEILVYSSSERIYHLDKNGNIMMSEIDKGDKIFTEMDSLAKKSYTVNNIKYRWYTILSYNFVTRTENRTSSIIYQDSPEFVVVSLLFSMTFLVFLIVIMIYVLKLRYTS